MRNLLYSPKVIIPTLSIASIYVIFVIYLMNGQLVRNTLLGDFPLSYKITLLVNLLGGMWTAMTGIGLFTLILTAVLTGVNLTLITQRISALRNSGNLHIVVGGSSLLGLVGSGCAACGLPLISLFGLTGSLVYLPLRGVELSYLAVILLSVSLYFLIRSKRMIQSCEIRLNKA